jgi:hypothetical protein
MPSAYVELAYLRQIHVVWLLCAVLKLDLKHSPEYGSYDSMRVRRCCNRQSFTNVAFVPNTILLEC